VESGKITVIYDKENYEFKLVCLNRHGHNKFYPDSHLAVCFELELEGIGNSKDLALESLTQLIDIYFNQTREIYKELGAFKEAIQRIKDQQNYWKQFFAHLYEEKIEKNSTIYYYQITVEDKNGA
jgi:hypothetical protein